MKTRGSKRRKVPRYQIITARLLADIQSGRYPVGTLLPTEVELCKIFRTSRHTMREALRTITTSGLVVRRPRVGSMVIASEQPSVFTQSIVSLELMRNYPPDTYR
jgi:GntR family transcriptional regulator